MSFFNRSVPSVWEVFLSKYFAPPVIILQDLSDFTFQPSAEFISELCSSFTTAKIRKFENGETYSAYCVDYNIGGNKGNAICKTSSALYPSFSIYDSLDEYRKSFEYDEEDAS